MIGNILFGLTCLFYFGLSMFTFSQPRLSGESAMGYGLGLAFWGLGIGISTLLLALNIGWNGGFDWISADKGIRYVVVGTGWLALVAATFFCAHLKWEWHGEFPVFIRWLSMGRADIWLPLLLLIPSLFLLNPEWRGGMSAGAIALSMKLGYALSILISLGLLFGWLRDSVRMESARVEQRIEEDSALQKDHLNFIAAQKPEESIVNILAWTGRFHTAIVHNSAVAKVKSHPKWEAEMIELLDNEYYYHEVYTFIDGNKVDHPELFVEPIKGSIFRMAKEIEGLITDSNNLQDWHFDHFGIERLFRAIDEQFKGLPGADFRPAVLALRKALDTPKPERFKSVRFTITPIIDNWLKAHP